MEKSQSSSEANTAAERTDRAKLVKVGVVLLLALTFFVAVLTVNQIKQFAYIGDDIPVHRTISVSGEGEVFAVPDTAMVWFQIIEEGSTIEEVQEAAADRMTDALKALADLDIPEKDIKTTNYSLNPRYEYRTRSVVCSPGVPCPPERERTLAGYELRQRVEVKVRDQEKASTLVGRLGQAGVQQISNVEFTIDDPDTLQAEARAKAISDARGKADTLADQLGIRLVRVVNFHEQRDLRPYLRDTVAGFGGGAEDDAVEPPLPTGENKIVSSVTITYEIE